MPEKADLDLKSTCPICREQRCILKYGEKAATLGTFRVWHRKVNFKNILDFENVFTVTCEGRVYF